VGVGVVFFFPFDGLAAAGFTRGSLTDGRETVAVVPGSSTGLNTPGGMSSEKRIAWAELSWTETAKPRKTKRIASPGRLRRWMPGLTRKYRYGFMREIPPHAGSLEWSARKAAWEGAAPPGGPAALSMKAMEVGQRLCVPPFRMVCPCQA